MNLTFAQCKSWSSIVGQQHGIDVDQGDSSLVMQTDSQSWIKFKIWVHETKSSFEIEREMHQIMDTNYHIAPGVHPVGGHTKVLHWGL